jgi:hypothetical protein
MDVESKGSGGSIKERKKAEGIEGGTGPHGIDVCPDSASIHDDEVATDDSTRVSFIQRPDCKL